MARTTESWKLISRRGIWSVRFSHEGVRYEFSTRTRDRRQATVFAAQIYGEVLAGRVKKDVEGKLVHPATSLADLVGEWIVAIAAEIGRNTDKTYETYGKHWVGHFETIGNVNPATIGTYQRTRLLSVVRTTVVKERSALRRFLSWLVERQILRAVPEFPPLAKKALGTRKVGRRGAPTPLTPEQVERLLAALPEWTTDRHGNSISVRARLVFAYETALRPTLIDLIEWEDLVPKGLRIRKELDKNRRDRVVPLSQRAQEALARVRRPGATGRIFGEHDLRASFTTAAKKALGRALGSEVTQYDLKHARVTAWERTGMSVAGMEYLTGTKKALASYVLASREAAEAIVRAPDSGDQLGTWPGKLCEGEDSNLHGSYPASTSSSWGPKKPAEKPEAAPAESAAKRPPERNSGDRPQSPEALAEVGPLPLTSRLLAFIAMELNVLPSNDSAKGAA